MREELERKGVDHEDFVMDDLCPTGGDLTKVEIIKGLKAARKRANARCYAFVSIPLRNAKVLGKHMLIRTNQFTHHQKNALPI